MGLFLLWAPPNFDIIGCIMYDYCMGLADFFRRTPPDAARFQIDSSPPSRSPRRLSLTYDPTASIPHRTRRLLVSLPLLAGAGLATGACDGFLDKPRAPADEREERIRQDVDSWSRKLFSLQDHYGQNGARRDKPAGLRIDESSDQVTIYKKDKDGSTYNASVSFDPESKAVTSISVARQNAKDAHGRPVDDKSYELNLLHLNGSVDFLTEIGPQGSDTTDTYGHSTLDDE